MMGEYDAGHENCIDAMVRQMEDMQFRIDSLHRENVKLRKLVQELWEYVKEYADSLDAEVQGYLWPTNTHGYGDKVRNGLGVFMRELGVEVD